MPTPHLQWPARPALLPLLLVLFATLPGVTSAQTVAPGDDFFAYANSAWLQSTTIPAGKDRWGARGEIDLATRSQVASLLEQARTAPAGSTARKVADFLTAYQDEAIIDRRGLTSLRPLLDSIARLADRTALVRFLGRTMPVDVDPLNWGIFRSSQILGLAVELGIDGEGKNVAILVQGGLGLPDREDYLSADTAKRAAREVYRARLARMLSLAGFDQADARAARVLELERAIAESQISVEASANDHRADTAWTRAEFAQNAPGIDWTAFFTAAGLGPADRIIPWQTSAVRGMATLVATRPLEVWRDYLRTRALDRYADVLPPGFRGETTGTRSERALAALKLALGEGLGRMYAERYFSAAQKARVQGVVANVVAAFTRRVESSTWMTPATKAQSIAKIRALYVGIGYPDRWQDFSGLVIDPADALGNVRRAEARNHALALAKLGRAMDRGEWWISPERPGGLLMFQQNAYDFTAALLQPPKYDSTASDAATYGAIGAIIGHDVTHYVDLLGADFELSGRERRWWTAEDLANYETLARPMAEQFSAYRPFPDMAVDGAKTRSENIADLAGLSAAFDAYRATIADRLSDTAFVHAQDRIFFIAFAQSWRSQYTEAALRSQLATDTHAPDRYRIATVRNLDAWYEAFGVRPGAALYLPPAARVRVW